MRYAARPMEHVAHSTVPGAPTTPVTREKKNDSPHWFSRMPLYLALYFVFCDGKKPEPYVPPKPAATVKKLEVAPMPREVKPEPKL